MKKEATQIPENMRPFFDASIGCIRLVINSNTNNTRNTLLVSKEFAHWAKALAVNGWDNLLSGLPPPVHFTTEEVDAYAKAAYNKIEDARVQLDIEREQLAMRHVNLSNATRTLRRLAQELPVLLKELDHGSN